MNEYKWLANYDEGVAHSLEPYPDQTLVDYLREAAEKWPNRPAILFKGAVLSYRDLDRASDAFAAALEALGVKRGDRVGLCLPNCPQFMVAEFGAWKVGAIACPFNPTYTAREMEDALLSTGAETVVVLNRFYGQLKSIQAKTSVKRLIATGIKDSCRGIFDLRTHSLRKRRTASALAAAEVITGSRVCFDNTAA